MFHRNLIVAIVAALKAIFGQGLYADKVVESLLKSNRKWGARDRRFVAETIYDTVRWWRLDWAILGRDVELIEPRLWEVVGVQLLMRGMELPDWDEFKWVNLRKVETRRALVSTVRRVSESVPDWLDELGEAELGERWERELRELNRPAQVVLRANRLQVTRDELARRLTLAGIESRPVDRLEDALVLAQRQNAMATRAFQDGLFEVQDAGSQRVALLLGVAPGMRVIDACAGAGGKTLHLAALMRNRGRIIALDVDGRRLEELKRRARRAGATNIEPRLVDSMKVVKRLAETADRVLLDVPCSGLGVLRRNPDTKWKLTPESIERIRVAQRGILADYARLVKPGGRLVYATCSILPSENERQVESFLATRAGDFALVEQRMLWPSETGFDGFFMALIGRGARTAAPAAPAPA